MMKPISFALKHPAAVLVIFIVLGFLAYFQTISYPFVHDDVVFIVQNPDIKHLDIGDAFRPKIVGQAASDLINVYYRPLITLFHQLQYQLFGLNPAGYHFINILFHIINAFLLYILMGKLVGQHKGAHIVIALFFLIHPLQTEAVACISGISNILLLLFLFTSLLLYLEARNRASKKLYAGSLIIFLAGCFVKEQMIVLSLVIIVYECLLAERDKRSLWGPAGFIGTLLVYFLLRRLLLGFTLTSIFDPYGEYIYRFMAIPRSLVTYLSLIVFPRGLHYYRSIDVLESNTVAWIILGCLFALAIYLIVKSHRNIRKYLLFGWAWFFITLLPMLNIVPLVNEYSTILNFEHFLYIPIIGVFIFLVLFAEQGLQKVKQNKGGAVILVVLSLAAISIGLTIRQNTYWRNEIALFNRALQYQESGRIRILLGKAYYFQKDYERAMEQYYRALSIMNSYIAKTPLKKVHTIYKGYIKGIYFDLAHCYEDVHNPKKAVIMYEKALEIDPNDEVLYNNLAVIYIKQAEYKRAIDYLETALVINKDSQLTRQNLAYCYVQVGQKDKADKLFLMSK